MVVNKCVHPEQVTITSNDMNRFNRAEPKKHTMVKKRGKRNLNLTPRTLFTEPSRYWVHW